MRTRETDRAQFSAFCEQEYPGLVRALHLVFGDERLAEDFAQEALARAWLRWVKLRRIGLPTGWVYRTAINLGRSHFRRRMVERRFEDSAGASARVYRDPDPSQTLAIHEALKKLAHRQRLAVILRYYLGLSVAESAAAMDCPEATVRTLCHRGLAALRKDRNIGEIREVESGA